MDYELYKIEAELLSGKILVLPPAIYDRCIEFVRNAGMNEEAIKNISKSSWLPASELK